MAEWKKVVVSGSDISQLNNDAGYVAAVGAGIVSGSDQINHDSTTGFVANEHINHSSVSISSGNGLTGGGDITTTRTLAVGQGDGISVTADAVAVDATVLRTTGDGVVSGSAQIFSDVSGDVLIASNGVATIQNNSVALGTNTTGNYVASLGTGTGVTIGSNTGEGSNPTIAVNYGSSANTAVQGNTSLSFTGAANEITVDAGSSITLGSGGTVTLGLADSIGGNRTFTGNVTVNGDLTVLGDAVELQTSNLLVEDAFILLRSGSASAGDSGIIFGGSEGTANSGNLLFWDADYNSSDGRLSVATGVASNATGAQTAAYRIAGVYEGTAVNAATAQADHPGNIRVDAGEIYIYV